MKTEISDHFTIKKMMMFTLLPIISILFCSVYSVVDGVFVSNFTDATSFAAVNLMAPYTLIFPCFGFMVGSGGNAFMSKLLGENKKEEANKTLYMLVKFSIIAGIVLMFAAMALAKPFALSQGADGKLLHESMVYGMIMLAGVPFFALQFEFQNFAIAADKSVKGFLFMLLAGLVNIILDAVFVAGLGMGVAGAAIASVIGQIVGGIGPMILFLHAKEDELHFVKAKINWKIIRKACGNGSSEMLSNLSVSIVSMLYNFQLMRLIGVAGVDAYGVMQYVMMLFGCVFMGYCMGIVPVVGYHYGADNRKELKSLLRGSLGILLVYEIILFAIAEFFAYPLANIFLNDHPEILAFTVAGFRIYALSTLCVGVNMFISAYFTALNNGKVSAILSTTRSLVLPIILVFTLPLFLSIDGVWISVVTSEVIALIISITTLRVKSKQYGY